MNKTLLEARELRAKNIELWLSQGHSSLISIHGNIPGENKSIFEAYCIVRFFEYQIKKMFSVMKSERFDSKDGPYTLIALNTNNPEEVKRKLITLEDELPLGRLVDLDLWTVPDLLWSRSTLHYQPRTCFICGDVAHHCIRSQKHTLDETLRFVKEVTRSHLKNEVKHITKYAMMKELMLEEKFGLVTPTSPGSHDDMDFLLMTKAQDIIIPYFGDVFCLGYDYDELYQLLELARPMGIKTEKDMLEITGGVNCYKGLIFILGLVALSLGYTIKHRQDLNHVFMNIHTLSQHLLSDFEKEPQSFGEYAYRDHQISGARGEAYLGLPSVHHALHAFSNKDLSDTVLRQILQMLIQSTDDTVLLKRSGSFENYINIKKKVASLDVTNLDIVKAFTLEAIEHNLSFGGSADLLIATIFLHEIEQRYF